MASLTDPPAGKALPYALRDFLEFGGPVKLTSGLRAAHRAIGLPAAAPLGEQVLALGAYIAKRFEYRKNVTTYDSTTEDFLKIGGGVCQDFAHLMLGLLRLREEIRQIDLPVFREVPARPPDRIVTSDADVSAQQQQ